MRDIPETIFNAQRWGGTVAAPTEGNDFQQVVKVALDRQYTRPWSLIFNAPILATGGDPSVDASEVGGVGLGVAPGVPAPSGFAPLPFHVETLVKLRYGESAAMSEAVMLDWPARGGAFDITAAFVEVSVKDKGTIADNRARFAVSLNHAPAMRSRHVFAGGVNPVDGPRFTRTLPPFAQNSIQIFTIPRRAVAVRALTWNAAGSSVTSSFPFYDGAGNYLGTVAPGAIAPAVIPNGAEQIGVLATAAAVAGGWLQYELSL